MTVPALVATGRSFWRRSSRNVAHSLTAPQVETHAENEVCGGGAEGNSAVRDGRRCRDGVPALYGGHPR